MNLPESIEALTEEKKSDSFLRADIKPHTNIHDIIFHIKQKISPEYSKSFEEGLVYYKSSANEKLIISNILSLYSESIIKQVRESNIDKKSEVIDLIQQNMKTISQLIEHQFNFLKLLNKDNKIIDATKLSYIMLGYAIETIKKIHNA